MTSIAPFISSTTTPRPSPLEPSKYSARRDSRYGPARRALVHAAPNWLKTNFTRAPRAHLSPALHLAHPSALQSSSTCTATAMPSTAMPSSAAPFTASTPATTADFPPTAAASPFPSPSDPSPYWLQRTTLLLGPSGVSSLAGCRVLVVGLGGVGSFVTEFLVRAGVGSLAIVDGDVVDVTNKNRQLLALDSTIGQSKAQVMAARLRDINPALNLVVRQEFLMPDGAAERLLDEVAADLHSGAQSGDVAAAAAGEEAVAAALGVVGCHADRGYATTASLVAFAATATTSAAAASAAIGRIADDGAMSVNSSVRITRHAGTSTGPHRGQEVGRPDVQSRGAREEDCGGGGGKREDGVTVGCGSARGSQPPPVSRAVGCVPRLDWVVDCIDSVAPKLALVAAARARGSQVVSSMGAGGRLDPLAVRVADISETSGDPFAASVRRGLRRQYGVRDGVTAVFSVESCARSSLALTSGGNFKRSYYGTISYIPALFGLTIAAHIVNSVVQGPMIASEAAQRRQLARERGTSPAAPPGGGPAHIMGRKGKGTAPPPKKKPGKDAEGNVAGDGSCS